MKNANTKKPKGQLKEHWARRPEGREKLSAALKASWERRKAAEAAAAMDAGTNTGTNAATNFAAESSGQEEVKSEIRQGASAYSFDINNANGRLLLGQQPDGPIPVQGATASPNPLPSSNPNGRVGWVRIQDTVPIHAHVRALAETLYAANLLKDQDPEAAWSLVNDVVTMMRQV